VKTKLVRILAPLFSFAVFGLALWALYHELRTYHPKDILAALHSLPATRLLLTLLLTSLSYTAATGYDTLSARYLGLSLPYRRTALAAFTGTTFSNNMGLGILTGGSIRFRLYAAWGLSAGQISRLVLFNALTLWLGFLSLGGIVFTLEPLTAPRALHLPFVSVRPIGLAFLVIVASYLVLTLVVRKPMSFRGRTFEVPRPRFFPLQIAVALVDWGVAGASLYVLLPAQADLSYPAFLGIYMLALLAGILSQVPGGLGVFETVFLLLMSSRAPASQLLGSLLAYRGIYYLLPLTVAFVMLGGQELRGRAEGLRRASAAVGRWSSVIAVPLLTVLTLAGGVVLLLSGATAAVPARLAWLDRFLPLPILETSHFLGSVVGIALIFLARGIQRRLDAAWVLTALLLAAGVVLSLLKGLDYEEAIILGFMLLVLLPSRRYFYRRASVLRPSFSPAWFAAIAFAILSTAWLTLFSFKHVEYSSELWWRFALDGHAPRSLRALTGAGVAALLASFAVLLRPSRHARQVSNQTDWERIVPIVRQSPDSAASLALLGDKEFLMSDQGGAFVMYGRAGRSWVSMGDPVGCEEQWPDLIWSFRELADSHGCWSVFYEVAARNLTFYLDLGLALYKLGEEARVSLPSFTLEGGTRKGLRYTLNRIDREGATFELLAPEQVPARLPELQGVSDAWLKEKNTREKGFSLGRFDPRYLAHFPVGIVRAEGRLVAFCNAWAGDNKEELSIDLMRHSPDAPSGIMEYLFIRLMLWGKQAGYRWFNLGMVPLAGLPDRSLAPVWSRLGTMVFRHGEYFYNFQGLRQFKEKFDPKWTPRYLAAPRGLALPTVLANLAALISGGLRGLVAK
jgi:phosphatidylglycerol lysyltransferase